VRLSPHPALQEIETFAALALRITRTSAATPSADLPVPLRPV